MLGSIGNKVLRFFGGSSSRKIGSSAGHNLLLPGWLALALALACFGGGYLVGDKWGMTPEDTGIGLTANGQRRQAPALIEPETRPLASEAFFVAAYTDQDEVEGRARAIRLSEYLQQNGFPKARPYSYSDPQAGDGATTWFVTVYFRGKAEQAVTRAALRELPADVPCDIFRAMRNKGKRDWPLVYGIL